MMHNIINAAQNLIATQQADLSDAGKAFCEKLTAEQWRVARGESVLSETDIQNLEILSSATHFSDKEQTRQRLYELAQIAKLGNAITHSLTNERTSIAALIEELEADIHTSRNTPSSYAILGACHMLLDNHDLGVYYFNKANQITAKNNCITAFMRYSRAMPAQSVFAWKSHTWAPNDLQFMQNPARFTNGVVAVVSGNTRYINHFFENYARFLSENHHGAFAGIHVMWVREKHDEAEAIASALSVAKQHFSFINVTHEQVDCSDKRSYFAMSRFLMARKLLDHYKMPLMITDLDFQLRTDPRPTIKQLNYFDVSFIHHNKPSVLWSFPWLRSMAGCVWVNDTDASREFLRLMEIGYRACFNPAWLNWGVDQNLLSCALHFCQSNSQIKFAPLADITEKHIYGVPVDLKKSIS